MSNIELSIARELEKLSITKNLSGYKYLARAVEICVSGVDRLSKIYDTICKDTGCTRGTLRNSISYCIAKSTDCTKTNGEFIFGVAEKVRICTLENEYSSGYSYTDIIEILRRQEELDNAFRESCSVLAETTESCPYEDYGVCKGNKECVDTAECYYRYFRSKQSSIDNIRKEIRQGQ